MPPRLPRALAVAPRGPLDAVVAVPGSKSLSNRALVAAALARGESRLSGVLGSEDIEAMRAALVALGAEVQALGRHGWRVRGSDGALRAPSGTLDARASGTAARFLTAIATLAPGPSLIDGTPRLRERPIADLAEALSRLGAEVEVLGRNGCPPVRIAGGGLPGGAAAVDARRSSQTVSALLLAAPYARADVELELVEGALVSRPYVELTLQVMRDFGAEAGWTPAGRLHVRAGHGYRGRRYAVEPDASSAAYFFCAAAIAGGRVRVPGLRPDSVQADLGLLAVLEQMGCRVARDAEGVEVTGPDGALAGVDVDMNAMPDAVLALAVTAAFASGPTRIRNVAHLRLKESDRLAALERELGKLGCAARAEADALAIEPGPLHGAEIATYDDHRMAMAFALAGLRVPGVVIRDPACVAKSWPKYFDALGRL
jgi:3-phosphoshikimate 1-carboxyvinyltransferase